MTTEQSFSLKVDKYIFLKTTDSTNLYAQELLSKSYPDSNYCIYTTNQVKGRGQIDRSWYSGKNDNLSCSYLFKLKVAANRHFDLNKAFSLSIHDFLSQYIPEEKLTIKWPNDIYYNNKKIAGILIQNSIREQLINHVIFGVGINVNQIEFPDKLPNPISLFQINHQKYELIHMLHELQKPILKRMTQVINNIDLRNEYEQKLYNIGQERRYRETGSNREFEAVLLGINNDGKLKLKEGDQEVKLYNFREIEFII